MPKCSIVIRCYNEEQHIGRLLSGIMQQNLDDYEIIIVDSGSTDATVAIASRYPIKLVSIKPEEFSFGRALNLGCQEADGDIIVIVSAHVYPVHRDWLEQLLEPFQDEKIAITYGKQRGNEVTKYSEHQVFAKWFPDESHKFQDHPFCNNANAAVRRSIWQEIPYDESLTGLEDLDWAKKVLQLGYKLAYVASAEIVHVHEEPPQKIYNRYRREAIALKNIFPQEHFNLIDFLRLFIGNLFSDYYHAWHDGLLWDKFGEIFTFRLMQFGGTYKGFREQKKLSSELKQRFYYPKGFVRSEITNPDKEQKHRVIDYSSLPKEKEIAGNY